MTIMKRILLALIICGFLLPTAGMAEPGGLNETLAKLSAAKEPFVFAVIGDNRSGDRIYKKIMGLVMARKPLFVVNTGDIIPNAGNRKQWGNFKELSKEITVPYFYTPGNHDIDDKKSEIVWREEVDFPGKETYYSFTAGKNLFVVLNTCDPDHEKKIEGEQLAWLRKTLDPSRYQHQFVFLHHPPYLPPASHHNGESLDQHPKLRDELHRLFAEKRVDAVIAGHEHTFKRMEKDGVTYIITGGAGAPLYGKDSYNHLLIMRVEGAIVEAKVIDREGTLRQEFSIRGTSKN